MCEVRREEKYLLALDYAIPVKGSGDSRVSAEKYAGAFGAQLPESAHSLSTRFHTRRIMLPLLFNRTALAARAQCSATPRAIRSPLIARPLSTNPLSANSPASIRKSTLIRNEEAANTIKTLPPADLRSQSHAKIPSSTPHNSLSLNNLDESIRVLLPLLKAQGSVYITAHIHARPYLLTVGDTLRLPFLMPAVVPGDILRLNRASHIGSRDYTLKGAPYIDEQLFECRARVLGVESEPMRVKEKTKRRQRRVKKVKSKHRYTLLKVAELKIKSLQDIGL